MLLPPRSIPVSYTHLPISKLCDACGGLREDTYKLIMGGPMMGLAQYNVDVTVCKGTGAMLRCV